MIITAIFFHGCSWIVRHLWPYFCVSFWPAGPTSEKYTDCIVPHRILGRKHGNKSCSHFIFSPDKNYSAKARPHPSVKVRFTAENSSDVTTRGVNVHTLFSFSVDCAISLPPSLLSFVARTFLLLPFFSSLPHLYEILSRPPEAAAAAAAAAGKALFRRHARSR